MAEIMIKNSSSTKLKMTGIILPAGCSNVYILFLVMQNLHGIDYSPTNANVTGYFKQQNKTPTNTLEWSTIRTQHAIQPNTSRTTTPKNATCLSFSPGI